MWWVRRPLRHLRAPINPEPMDWGYNHMFDRSEIKKHADVIGADGVHVGTVDHLDGDRIKLTKKDSSDQRHHYISVGLIAEVEDGTVRLSANADVAVSFEEPAPE